MPGPRFMGKMVCNNYLSTHRGKAFCYQMEYQDTNFNKFSLGANSTIEGFLVPLIMGWGCYHRRKLTGWFGSVVIGPVTHR